MGGGNLNFVDQCYCCFTHYDLLFSFAHFSLFVYSVLALNTLKFLWDTGADVNIILVTLHVTALEFTTSLTQRARYELGKL
jgi:hypothetical protein